MTAGDAELHCERVKELLGGYARVSTEQQDLTSQRDGLHALGVTDNRIAVQDVAGIGHRASDTGAGEAVQLCERRITKQNVKLSLGGSIQDPTDPIRRLLFNVSAMVAEFESNLVRMRTREGTQVAKAKARLKGKQPKLKPNQARHLVQLHDLGTYCPAEPAELFGVADR